MSNTISKMAVGELTLKGDTALPIKVGAFTAGATMTVSPETTAESGFITVTIAGTDYQIPVYAA
jgi:hypothetical protein